MSKTQVTADPGLPFIDVRRAFDAPRELVFRAFTDPELLVQWLGPRKYAMVIDEFDTRDGGRWRYINRDDDGNEWAFHGVFHGTPSLDGVTQTFEYEGAPGHVSLDALTFEEADGRTVVHLHSVYQTLEARDAMVAGGMADGLADGFTRLDELIGRLTPGG
jgi:uncharacterized protein YndB with AHSA1/START domain